MAKTILQAIKDKLSASGVTVADGLDGKGLTISEAIAALELDDGEGITPTGTITLDRNDNYVNVSQYAQAIVEVPSVLFSYDANGGTGTVLPTPGVYFGRTLIANAETLTPPEGKKFKCWRLGDPAGEGPDLVPGPNAFFQVTQDVTWYAIWEDV